MDHPQPLLKVESPIAKELEGYVSIGSDLHYVMRVTHDAVQFLQNEQEDDFTLLTYLSAALVAYARPFKDGVRGIKNSILRQVSSIKSLRVQISCTSI